jgi:hypothetical protein
VEVNHSITIGELLLALGALAGLGTVAVGALMMFAAGMSDAGDDGTGKNGCLFMLCGALVAVACLLWLFA